MPGRCSRMVRAGRGAGRPGTRAGRQKLSAVAGGDRDGAVAGRGPTTPNLAPRRRLPCPPARCRRSGAGTRRQRYGPSTIRSRVPRRHRGAALAALGPGASPTRARLLVELANELDPHDWSHRVSLCEEARKMAERLGDEATLLHVLTGYAFDLAADTTGQLDGLVAATYDLTQRVGDLSDRFQAVQSLIVERGRATDIGAVDRLLPQAARPRRRVEARSAPLCRRLDVGMAGNARWQARPRRGLRRERYEAGKKAGDPSAFANFAVQLSQIGGQQGRGAEVIETLPDAVESAPGILVMRTVLVGLSGPGDDAVACSITTQQTGSMTAHGYRPLERRAARHPRLSRLHRRYPRAARLSRASATVRPA